jgi:hypothetical protein
MTSSCLRRVSGSLRATTRLDARWLGYWQTLCGGAARRHGSCVSVKQLRAGSGRQDSAHKARLNRTERSTSVHSFSMLQTCAPFRRRTVDGLAHAIRGTPPAVSAWRSGRGRDWRLSIARHATELRQVSTLHSVIGIGVPSLGASVSVTHTDLKGEDESSLPDLALLVVSQEGSGT